MRIKLLPFLTIATTVLIAVPVQVFLSKQAPHVFPSPENQVLSATDSTKNSKLETRNYETLGFLPYWLINQSEYIPYQHLTQLAYFGIEFDDQAELKTREPDNSKELGYQRLNQTTVKNIIHLSHQNQVSPILVVKILNNPGIESAIDPTNRQKVINEIIQQMTDNHFSGINIDLEYIRTPPRSVQQNFTEFIKILNQKLKTNNYQLTVDIYADTATKQTQRLWQLAELSPHIDQFIVMAYDFHRPTSPSAGPVAPLRGANTRWDEDIITSLRDITKLVPPQKIILGIPFYGYEWTTISPRPVSLTTDDRGYLATYTRVKDLLKTCNLANDSLTKNCISGFDPDALSPYLIYSESDKYQQIWYENPQSLQYKIQLVKQANLAGIAIWALGYDAPHPDLWETINQKLNNSSTSSTSPN